MDKWQKLRNENKAKTTAQINFRQNAMDSRNSSKTALKMLPETVMETKHPMHMTKSRMIILADTKEE